jgi:hypothetical protein
MYNSNRTRKGAVLFFRMMNQRELRLTKLGSLFSVLCVVAGLRYAWLSQQAAATWVIHTSYWFLLALMVWTIVAIARLWRDRARTETPSWREQAVMLAPVGVLAVMLHVQEPHLLKVNYDENVLMGISRTMHYEHLAGWPGGAHLYYGTTTPVSIMADKRPVFFPFLLSIVHTLTGYRVANAFVLNGLVGAGFLFGLYGLGRAYQSSHGGVLLAVLLAGVPLVAQIATSGAFDLLNAALIVALGLRMRAYVSVPTGRRLELLTLVSLCLANTRYESMLYVLAPAVAFLAVWRRERAMPELPWTLVLAPIGLLPALLSNAVFNSSDTFLQAGAERFWALGYFPHNISHALYYLFNPARGGTNSVWLAALGMVALVLLLFVLRWQAAMRRPLRPETLALIFVGGLIACNVGVALGLRWGAWDDPLVSRFSLPFWVLLGWSVLEVARHLEEAHRWLIVKPLTYVSLAIVFLFALPDASQARATHKLKAGTALAWALDFLKEYDPHRSVLVLANSSIPYINEGYAALPLDKSLVKFPKYAATVQHGLYRDVLIVAEERRDRETGAWVSDAKHQELMVGAKLQELSQLTIDPFYRLRIFRVIGIVDPSAALPWPVADDDPDNYQRRVYELMP